VWRAREERKNIMALLDSLKRMFSGKKGAEAKAQVQKVVQKVDDQAEKLATKDGVVGTVAEKAHEVLDKIDGD
jgi:hypothetical protein